jgi:hypothetical protein
MSSTSTTWTTDTNTKSGTVQVYSSDVSVLKIVAGEGGNAILDLFADQGDDNADKWRMWVNAGDDDLHFSNYTSGTAWTDILTLQDGGAVGIGTGSPDNVLEVSHADTSNVNATNIPTNAVAGIHIANTANSTDYGSAIKFSSNSDTVNTAIAHVQTASTSADLVFYTESSGTFAENMRIKNGGNVGIGESSPDYKLHVTSSTDSSFVAQLEHSDADNPYGLYINYTGGAPDDTSKEFLRCRDTTAIRTYIKSDGDVWTIDATILSSDRELKENIVDASPKLEDILKLKVRNFNFKSSYTKNIHKRIGFIAQEVEEVFPALVGEELSPINTEREDGIKRKSIKMSFIPMLVKAIQELSAKVEALENA